MVYSDVSFPTNVTSLYRLSPYVINITSTNVTWNFSSSLCMQGNRVIFYSSKAQTYIINCPYLYV